MPIRFDDSLGALVDQVVKYFGEEGLAGGVALRESSGRLTFFLDAESTAERLEQASEALRQALGVYARPDRVLADRESPGAARILADPSATTMDVGGRSVRLVDRRVVGVDWQESPAPEASGAARFVFGSLKGGVGRSTALSVVAVVQAQKARNVLVVDLDLEAPGIGSMLLSEDRRPRYGALDFLVESSLGDAGALDLDEFVGTSALAPGAGLVDVVPVAGTRSEEAPHNYLAKLSRAMTESVLSAGGRMSVREKAREMIDRMAGRRPYDLVLIDARAGMAELAAGPLLGLGATTVFLFGTAQPQTLEAYRYLFAHLSTLRERAPDLPWQALKMVHAKASLSEDEHATFTEQLSELFSEFLYDEQDGLEGFNFDIDDRTGPHYPIPIPLDTHFHNWDPIRHTGELTQAYYGATFGALLNEIENRMGA